MTTVRSLLPRYEAERFERTSSHHLFVVLINVGYLIEADLPRFDWIVAHWILFAGEKVERMAVPRPKSQRDDVFASMGNASCLVTRLARVPEVKQLDGAFSSVCDELNRRAEGLNSPFRVFFGFLNDPTLNAEAQAVDLDRYVISINI